MEDSSVREERQPTPTQLEKFHTNLESHSHQAWRSFSSATGTPTAAALALIQSSKPSVSGQGIAMVALPEGSVSADKDGEADCRSPLPRLATLVQRSVVDVGGVGASNIFNIQWGSIPFSRRVPPRRTHCEKNTRATSSTSASLK